LAMYGEGHLAHRIVWLIATGEWPETFIDHIDGNRSNNRLENLRLADIWDNNRNSKKPTTNTSGIKGVGYRNGRWRAYITVNDRQIHIGVFDEKEDAAAAYWTAACNIFGEFARRE
jgi:hypothetical protein